MPAAPPPETTTRMSVIAFSTTREAWPAFRAEGLSFVTSDDWVPAEGRFGALAFIYGTLLVSAIAVSELMYMTNRAVFATKQPLMFYAACCLLYLVMAILSGIAQTMLEKHYNRGQNLARA